MKQFMESSHTGSSVLEQSMEVIHEINSPQVEELNHNLEQNARNSPEVEADHDLSQPEEHQRKRQKISKNQEAYNQKMVQQSKKKAEQKSSHFKVGDVHVFSIKIDKVDKPSPFYPNMLLGKITELENHYARVVTRFGKNPNTYFSYKVKPLHSYQSYF